METEPRRAYAEVRALNGDGPYLVAFAPCYACGRLFPFDPELVPSIPVDLVNRLPADVGEHGPGAIFQRLPVCRDCIGRANENRRATGRPLIEVAPNAYLDEG